MSDDHPNDPPRVRDATPPSFTSNAILQGDREVLVDHEGTIYQFRHTESGKLILNKPSDRYPPADTIRTIPSSALLQGKRMLIVLHEDETYRLAVTKAGKLILNK